jgi:hypothetical protein
MICKVAYNKSVDPSIMVIVICYTSRNKNNKCKSLFDLWKNHRNSMASKGSSLTFFALAQMNVWAKTWELDQLYNHTCSLQSMHKSAYSVKVPAFVLY